MLETNNRVLINDLTKIFKTSAGCSSISDPSEVRNSKWYGESTWTPPAFSGLSELEDVRLGVSYKVKESEHGYRIYAKVKGPTRKGKNHGAKICKKGFE